MRLIDSEELKHRINNSKYYGTERQRDFCDMIAESPTIDAVETVRCKECKHRYMDGDVTHYYWCKIHDRPVDDTDYCSWARAKESEADE